MPAGGSLYCLPTTRRQIVSVGQSQSVRPSLPAQLPSSATERKKRRSARETADRSLGAAPADHRRQPSAPVARSWRPDDAANLTPTLGRASLRTTCVRAAQRRTAEPAEPPELS